MKEDIPTETQIDDEKDDDKKKKLRETKECFEERKGKYYCTPGAAMTDAIKDKTPGAPDDDFPPVIRDLTQAEAESLSLLFSQVKGSDVYHILTPDTYSVGGRGEGSLTIVNR